MSRYRHPGVTAGLLRPLLAGAVLLLAGQVSARPAAAQTAPFSTVTVGAGAFGHLDSGALAEFWESPLTTDFRLSAPFYAGSVHFSFGTTTYRARSADQPDFESGLLTAGWSAATETGRGLGLRAGLQAGAMTMDFDDDATPVGNVEETELLLGVEGAISQRLVRGFGIELFMAGRRVFTRRPIDFFSLGLAGNYTVSLPDWLQQAAR